LPALVQLRYFGESKETVKARSCSVSFLRLFAATEREDAEDEEEARLD
jgi:hypothetical protein